MKQLTFNTGSKQVTVTTDRDINENCVTEINAHIAHIEGKDHKLTPDTATLVEVAEHRDRPVRPLNRAATAALESHTRK